MKIIHTSDWHLGQEFYSYDRTEEHEAFLQQLENIVAIEQPDALVISGDIYHNATPSNSVMKLFNDHLDEIRKACPSMQIIIIAGNHDSASRLEIFASAWRHLNVHVIGRIEKKPEGIINFKRHIIPIKDKGYIVAIPHVFPQNYPLLEENTPRDLRQFLFLKTMNQFVKEINTQHLPVVVAAHMAITGSEMKGHDLSRGGMDFTDIEKFGIDFDYLALGHIHCPQNIQNAKARYCGTPIPVSFDETYPHSVSIVTLTKDETEPIIRTIPIHNPWPLHTFPKEALPFEDAIEVLSNLPSDEPMYIRLRVHLESIAPANALERAYAVVKNKKLRFCCFKWEKDDLGKNTEHAWFDIEQMKQLNPVEIAELYHHDEFGEELDGTLKNMLTSIEQKLKEKEEE